MTADRVRERIATGKVTPRTKAWKEGMAEWLLLSAMSEFAPPGEGAPAAAAATSALAALPVLPEPAAAAPAAPAAKPTIAGPKSGATKAVATPTPAAPAAAVPASKAEAPTAPKAEDAPAALAPEAPAEAPAAEAAPASEAAPATPAAPSHTSVTTKVSRAARPGLAARSTSQRPALRSASSPAAPAAPPGPGALAGLASALRALAPATLPLRFQQPHRIERADLWRAFGMGFRLSRVTVGVGAMVAGAVAVIVIAIGAGIAGMIHYTLAIPFAMGILCATMASGLATGAALAFQTREEVLTGRTPGLKETFAFVRSRFAAIVVPPAVLTFSALAPLVVLVVLACVAKIPYAGPVATGLVFGLHILLGAATLFLLVAGALAWVFGPIIVAFEETTALETVQVLLDFVKRSSVRTALWSILPSLAYTGVATVVVVAAALVILVPLAVLAIVVGPDGMLGALMGGGLGGRHARGADPYSSRRYADEDGARSRLALGSSSDAPSRDANPFASRDAASTESPAPSAPSREEASSEAPAPSEAPAAPSAEEQQEAARQAMAALVAKAQAEAEARQRAARDAEEKRRADEQAKREAQEREKREAAEAAAKAKAAARAARPALPRSGFKPFPLLAADVKPLIGKTVWVEVGPMPNVRTREGGKEVFLYTGDELTVKAIGCYDHKKIDALDGWIVATTPSGEEIACQTIYLSLGKPLYEMRDAGGVKELLPKVFAQGFDIPLRYADFWKRVGYDADAEKDGHERQCYETAMNHHKWLLGQLVSGRTSKTNVLGEERYQWLWSNEELTDVFCEGMSYLDEWKKTPFFDASEKARDVLSTADAVQDAAGDVMMAKSELKRKYWLESLNKNAPKAQRDALDREETARCEKRIAECEKRVTDNRAKAEEGRAELEF